MLELRQEVKADTEKGIKMSFFQRTAEKTERRTINRVVELPAAAIAPNPAQPRIIFDDAELSRLAASIRANGILQPLTVRRVDDVCYELISGERRLRAAKLVGLELVPCIVVGVSPADSAILAVLENIQRADLNYLEEAYAIKNLIEHYGLTQETAAAKLGIAQSTVANKLRLLKLTDEEKALTLRCGLNERQARALLRLEEGKRRTAIEYISANGFNTAQTERYIDKLTESRPMRTIKRKWNINPANLYINSINKTISAMKEAGIKCETRRTGGDEWVEYVVRIELT